MPYIARIRVSVNGREHEVEMPGVTSCRYAAKRAAEESDLDPDVAEFCLYDPVQGVELPQDGVIAEYDGKLLVLGVV